VDLQLQDKVAAVTGASKGIGLAVTRTLAAEGMRVVAGARTIDSLHGIEGVEPLAVDLVEPQGPSRLVGHALEQHGRLDVLVNNLGGVKIRLDGFLATSDEEFARAMELNFFAALRATRAAVTAMLPRGGGTIVNVCSVNAFFQPDGLTIDYGAAKAALLNLSKALAEELGPNGIRVNCVSPGQVATDLWLGEGGVAATIGQAQGVSADAVRAQATAGLATGRFSTPEEVATLVALLASPRTANVTGSNVVIDGGLVNTV
jgi:NAD(P)-dependent dehydrogenase (short-subunit alcohol dehydrogenase family)